MSVPVLTRNGIKIWWDKVGSGSPLLIIQGLGYPSDASWRIIPELATRHTVVFFDNRGAGRSDVPAGTWTIETMAADAAAVLEAAEVGPAHIAGFSMGGLIAQELALSRPDLALSLVLGCTSPGGRSAIPLTAEVAEQFTDWGDLPAQEAAWRASRVCYSESTTKDEIEADIEVRMKVAADRRGYVNQLKAVAEFKGVADRISAWTRPTLVVHGDSDLIVPVANAERIREVIPHCEVVIHEGAGHILMTDARDELVAAMLEFMERADAGTAQMAAASASES